MGADDADALLADGLPFGGGGSGGLAVPSMAAAADTAPVRYTLMTAQVSPPIYPGGSLSELFSRGGWLGGFAAGFLGSGLLGLLFERGLSGGLGGATSYLGLIFQLALLVMLCRLIWTRWRGGTARGSAARSLRQLADPYLRSRNDWYAGSDLSARAGDAAGIDTPQRDLRPAGVSETSPRGGSK
jgi:predicted lipid-binding transport protein (Tim44 family)